VSAHLQGTAEEAGQTVVMTRDQFSKFIKSPAGLFDSLMDKGSIPTLKSMFANEDKDNGTVSLAALKKMSQPSLTQELAKLQGRSVDEIKQLYPGLPAQQAALLQQKQQTEANAMAKLKAQTPMIRQQMQGDQRAALQTQKDAHWDHIYDLKDRNETNKLLTQARIADQTHAGRNAIDLAKKYLDGHPGKSLADAAADVATQGYDLKDALAPKDLRSAVPGLGAAPTAASTQLPQLPHSPALDAAQAQKPPTVVKNGVTYYLGSDGNYGTTKQ
jgi:hypothetical protein